MQWSRKDNKGNIYEPTEKQKEIHEKILLGLEKVYERLIEFKKQKNTDTVVMKDNKIINIKPE